MLRSVAEGLILPNPEPKTARAMSGRPVPFHSR